MFGKSDMTTMEFRFAVDYLHALNNEVVKDPDFRVLEAFRYTPELTSIEESESPEIIHEGVDFYFCYSDWQLFQIKYKNEPFWVSTSRYYESTKEPPPCNTNVVHQIKVFCNERPGYFNVENQIAEHIKRESIKKSRLVNKSLKICSEQSTNILQLLRPYEVSSKPLSSIYMDKHKKRQIERFIDVLGSKENQSCLRYLLNGPPGTAKTELVKSIVEMLDGFVTIILMENRYVPFGELLGFCSMFPKCLLILDDIDLYVGNRDISTQGEKFSSFLSYMDGFSKSGISVLATTNDKNLVDAAAKRPGRFDIVIDMEDIQPENYLSLIKRESKDPEIIALFDDPFLTDLAHNKATGAFIVNLVKQIVLTRKYMGAITHEEAYELYRFLYKGFYKSNNISINNAVGF